MFTALVRLATVAQQQIAKYSCLAKHSHGAEHDAGSVKKQLRVQGTGRAVAAGGILEGRPRTLASQRGSTVEMTVAMKPHVIDTTTHLRSASSRHQPPHTHSAPEAE